MKAGGAKMEQQVLVFVMEKTRELMNAPSCSREAGEAAQNWLDVVGTPALKAQTQKYLAELETDIVPIDQLIHFAESLEGKEYFGEDTAARIESHAREIKAAGAKYCDCPACQAAVAILEKRQELCR